MKRITIKWKWILLPLFGLAAALVLNILGSYIHTSHEPPYLTPVFMDTKGWEIYTLTNGTRTDLIPQELMNEEFDETFYPSRVLTEKLEAYGYTFLLLSSNTPCSVFPDGELLYTTCPDSLQSIGQVSFPAGYEGLPQRAEKVRCTLPAGFAGKTLTIATVHKEYAAMPSIIFSSQAAETDTWMTTANHNSMSAAAFTVTALLLLGLLFFGLFQGKGAFPILLLTAAAFVHLFYYLRKYEFSSPSFTVLDTAWAAFLPNLIVILPELFPVVQMKRWRKPCAVLVLIPAAISLIQPLLNTVGLPVLSSLPFLNALYIGIGSLLVCIILEARDKNHVFQLFLVWLGSILAGIFVLCLFSWIGNGYYSGYLASVFRLTWSSPSLMLYWCGTILFVLSTAMSISILIRNRDESQTKLAVQAVRLSQLDHDLLVQKQFYETKLSTEEDLRSLRHDMRGHLSTLSALLAGGKTSEAAAYPGRLEEQHLELQTKVFCSEPYMNAVLEGSLLLPVSERSVKVQSTIRQKQLLFRISNRFDGTLMIKAELPISTKTEKGHGYGIPNIRSAAERMGGAMEYRVKNGYFVLDVRLPLQEDAEKGGTGHAV